MESALLSTYAMAPRQLENLRLKNRNFIFFMV